MLRELIEFRRAQGWSRKQLAEHLGITEMSVWRYEHKKSRPSWVVIRKLHELSGGEITAATFED